MYVWWGEANAMRPKPPTLTQHTDQMRHKKCMFFLKKISILIWIQSLKVWRSYRSGSFSGHASTFSRFFLCIYRAFGCSEICVVSRVGFMFCSHALISPQKKGKKEKKKKTYTFYYYILNKANNLMKVLKKIQWNFFKKKANLRNVNYNY